MYLNRTNGSRALYQLCSVLLLWQVKHNTRDKKENKGEKPQKAEAAESHLLLFLRLRRALDSSTQRYSAGHILMGSSLEEKLI